MANLITEILAMYVKVAAAGVIGWLIIVGIPLWRNDRREAKKKEEREKLHDEAAKCIIEQSKKS